MHVRKRLQRITRLVSFGAVVGGAIALRRAWARRHARTALGPPATWPPLEAGEPPVAAVGDLVTSADPPPEQHSPAASPDALPSEEPVAAVGDVADAPAPAWVEPDDGGGCPLTHPVKANGSSRIYHLPGGHFYDRTRPARCYVDAAAAEADGYRAAKG